MKIEKMKEIKEEMGLSYEMIAEGSGVSLGTVKKIFGGYVKLPRYDTMTALERFFSAGTIQMREAAFDYYAGRKKQGEYTIGDVEKIPKTIQVELIDGQLYYLAAPTPVHQTVALELAIRLNRHIDSKGGDCIAGIVATDFKLDADDEKTLVQPDVYVLCDRAKMGLKRMTGAPDLAIEILSPSNDESYRNRKLMKYRETGVREYWEINYDNGRIMVIQFPDEDGNASLNFHTVRDRIPVGIFDDLVIDFAEIDDKVQKYIDKCGGRDG
ncbi:MAG: Uma2 family endonuclease [Bacillota bacterium]